MKPLRIIFMGTPHFAVPSLQALLASPHEVVAAYSQPPRPAGRGMKLTPSPVQTLAVEHLVPVHTPTSLKGEEEQAIFRHHQADLAVVVAYGLLLPQAILDAPKHGCINLHPSDLPRWRGAAPLQRTLMAGDATTACCVMQMDAGLDTGPVLLRQEFPVPPHMAYGTLHDAMAQVGAGMLMETVELIAAGNATPTAQAADGVTYATKITKNDQWLNPAMPAPVLLNQIRGLSPAPGALLQLGGESFKIFAAQGQAGNAALPPGQLLDDQLLVNCGDGTALRLLELQRPGKSRQSATELLKGFAAPAGGLAESGASPA